MKTPGQILAKKTFARLCAEKLLTAAEVKKLLPKFVEGKARPEDWRLAIEKSWEAEAKE